MDRWKQRIANDNTNHWAVYELCKALKADGYFDGLSPVEQHRILIRECRDCGADVKILNAGWREYQESLLRGRTSA